MEKLVSVSKNKQNNPEQTKEQKQIGKERKGLIPSFASTCHGSLLKEVGQELRAGTEAEASEKGYLLACSSWVARPAYTFQDHLPRGAQMGRA